MCPEKHLKIFSASVHFKCVALPLLLPVVLQHPGKDLTLKASTISISQITHTLAEFCTELEEPASSNS